MKVYEALYCPNTWDSSYGTLSIHLSEEGAKKVIDEHKEEKRKEWQKLVDADKNKGTEWSYENMCPFGQDREWMVREVELLP